MQRIRRQFGAKFAEMLAASPTLLSDLQEIRRKNIKIRRVSGECGAESIPAHNLIRIGRTCNGLTQILYLAHEAEHVLRGQTPEPSVTKLTRAKYIKMSLDEETQCVVHECVVAGELLAAGYKLDADSMTWYRRWRRGGRKAVRKAVEKTVASGSKDRYPRFYGRQYDETTSVRAGVTPAPAALTSPACGGPSRSGSPFFRAIQGGYYATHSKAVRREVRRRAC